ncbi:ADP-ribosylglycohydrolase family protein, partial [Arthrospira platensis SPKY1]|nr:ADP-ribosylglycohydrolase family protein [Arthrospira platensis SPKY1]
AWRYDGYWTATGKVFDIGEQTLASIWYLKQGQQKQVYDEMENGNGSLMRIAPLVFYVKDLPIEQRFELVSRVSSLTHGHIYSILCCFYYVEYLRLIMLGID